MYNLIWADMFQLRKSVFMKVLLGITTVSALVMAVMAYLIPQGKVAGSLVGMGFMFSDVNVTSILGAVIASVYICSDFDHKVIHYAIATGHSRGAVIASKATVFSCALAVLLLPYVITTGIALGTGSAFSMGGVAVGFLHLLTSKAGVALSATEAWKLLGILATLIIVYVAQLSLCVPLALLLRKPVLVVAIYYGFSILSGQLGALSESYPLFDRIYAWTPYGGNYSFLTLDAGTGEIIKALAVSLLFVAAMLAVTYGCFRRADIK
jgi:ABC-2 type transport system permease protein